jgi:hypothetical protein
MTQVIIYNQDNGIPAVVNPTQEALDLYGITAIAIKDVPAGKPFKIIDSADLPDAPQETWVVSDADLTDGVGGEGNQFTSAEVTEEEQAEVQNAD